MFDKQRKVFMTIWLYEDKSKPNYIGVLSNWEHDIDIDMGVLVIRETKDETCYHMFDQTIRLPPSGKRSGFVKIPKKK